MDTSLSAADVAEKCAKNAEEKPFSHRRPFQGARKLKPIADEGGSEAEEEADGPGVEAAGFCGMGMIDLETAYFMGKIREANERKAAASAAVGGEDSAPSGDQDAAAAAPEAGDNAEDGEDAADSKASEAGQGDGQENASCQSKADAPGASQERAGKKAEKE